MHRGLRNSWMVVLLLAGCHALLPYESVPADSAGDSASLDGARKGDASLDRTVPPKAEEAAVPCSKTCEYCCQEGLCIKPGDQDPDLCGVNGAPCKACQAGQSCIQGACSCDPDLCPGCCDSATDSCIGILAQDNARCGKGGAACKACQANQICASGVCTCTPQSCPDGCCSGNDCVLYSAQNSSACGSKGAPCGACPYGHSCKTGKCVCGPPTCSGCCSAGSGSTICYPYNWSRDNINFCGKGGMLCTKCNPAYQVCYSGQCISVI